MLRRGSGSLNPDLITPAPRLSPMGGALGSRDVAAEQEHQPSETYALQIIARLL